MLKKSTLEPLRKFFLNIYPSITINFTHFYIVIILAFTTGALINYQPRNRKDDGRGRLPITRDESPSPRSSFTSSSTDEIDLIKSELAPKSGYPNTQRFRKNLTSQFLARFPFLLEIGYWFLTYWPYQLMRAYSAQMIMATPESKLYYDKMALDNAINVLKIEEFFGIDFEHTWQQFFLTKIPWSMKFIRFVYLAHITVGVSFLVYGYTYARSFNSLCLHFH